MPSSRALAFFVALGAAGCGLVSGLDSIVVDGGQSDAQTDDVAQADDLPVDQSTPDVITGDAGTALSSPNACSYIQGNSTLALSNTAFTIELWLQVKAVVSGTGEIDPILWNGGRTITEPGWTLALTSEGLVFCVADGSAAKCSSAYEPILGDLLHVGVVSSVSQSLRSAQIFVRDVTQHEVAHMLHAQLVNAVVDWGSTSTFTIGGAKAASLCSNAPSFVIDDLRIYNGAAPSSQFDSDMGVLPCNTSGLLAYFKFDEGAGASAADCSASKLVLTVAPFASFVPSPFP